MYLKGFEPPWYETSNPCSPVTSPNLALKVIDVPLPDGNWVIVTEPILFKLIKLPGKPDTVNVYSWFGQSSVPIVGIISCAIAENDATNAKMYSIFFMILF